MKNKCAGPLLACVASVLFAILPIIVTLVASSIASAHGLLVSLIWLVRRALAREGSPAGL